MSDLTIPFPPVPRQADIDAFTVWLMECGVTSPDPRKIHCTTGTLRTLKLPGIEPAMFLRGDVLVGFTQGWHLVHDYGDYRLTYDGRLKQPVKPVRR